MIENWIIALTKNRKTRIKLAAIFSILAVIVFLLKHFFFNKEKDFSLTPPTMGTNYPRGLRNNNPGNLKKGSSPFDGEIYPSKDPTFRQFKSMEWGYRALFKVIDKLVRNGNNTIIKLISKYAPPTENQTNAYVKYLAANTHRSADDIILLSDTALLKELAYYISWNENGVEPVQSQLTEGFKLYATNFA